MPVTKIRIRTLIYTYLLFKSHLVFNDGKPIYPILSVKRRRQAFISSDTWEVQDRAWLQVRPNPWDSSDVFDSTRLSRSSTGHVAAKTRRQLEKVSSGKVPSEES